MLRRVVAPVALVSCLLTSAGPAAAAPLTPEQRTERAAVIRDVAADNGISAGFLLAGIAQAETNLSHCWTELDWACQGPASVDCDGGPVVAGAGDGPCADMQGGLGMFQFDGGTFTQTIARDGDGVLLLSGNITRAVDFVVNMVMNSQYVPTEVDTPEEAKAWMNQVVVDGAQWDAWVTTVTHYYNGCTPSGCAVFADRYDHYADSGADVYFEQGTAFWEVDLPPCAPIPALGRTLEETDTCFTKGGPLPFWRVGIGGESNLHVWTGTTDLADPANYADWSFDFDEAGEYLVEVSVPGGTTPQAAYLVDHAGTTTQVDLDQSASDGFVELGAFSFDAGPDQGVFVGDNTGDQDGRRLVVDAVRLTRLDPNVGEGGAGAGGGAGSGSAGSGGGGVGIGGGDAFSDDGEGDAGCACALARTPRSGAPVTILALAAVVARSRRRRPAA